MAYLEGPIDEWWFSPDIQSLFDEFADAPPRTAAVLGGAILEDELERLVAGSVIDDRPQPGPCWSR